MTDWNLASKIFFGIAAGCVVLIALVAIARSRSVWSFVTWVAKGIWHLLVDRVKFLFDIIINLIIVWFVSALILIVFLIPLSLLNPRYNPDMGEGMVWVALAYLLYRVKKLEKRIESSYKRDQLDQLDDPLDNPPH
jgi:hypothetical protein